MDSVDSKIYVQKLVLTNLDFLSNEILPLISNGYAVTASQEVVDRLKQTVVALTDDNADNKNQLDLIWGNLSSDPELIEAVRGALNDAISKIDEPVLANGLKLLLTPVLQTLTAVTDKVKPDGEQIKKIWGDFIESPEFIAFILSNLAWIIDRVIKDENAKKWILKIINAFI